MRFPRKVPNSDATKERHGTWKAGRRVLIRGRRTRKVAPLLWKNLQSSQPLPPNNSEHNACGSRRGEVTGPALGSDSRRRLRPLLLGFRSRNARGHAQWFWRVGASGGAVPSEAGQRLPAGASGALMRASRNARVWSGPSATFPATVPLASRLGGPSSS